MRWRDQNRQPDIDVAALYVAMQGLHATLDLAKTVRSVQEIVVNLIGSETFAIYVANRDTAQLELLAQEGLNGAVHVQLLRQARVEQALREGRVICAAEPGDAPVACIPLLVDGHVLGAIVIQQLLAHKGSLDAVDRELLELLAHDGAIALYASGVHSHAPTVLVPTSAFLKMRAALLAST